MEKNIFQSIGMGNVPKSAFDKSHQRLMTANFGQLYPCYLEEILPGDSYSVKTEILARLAPMVGPTMHRVNIFVHYFFVSNRIIWRDWEEFITGGKDGLTTVAMPILKPTGSATPVPRSLWDYMGLPTKRTVNFSGGIIEVSQLPFRAYHEIYNEYYRDQNLEDPVDIEDTAELLNWRYRAWEKDYFTSALPFAQRGPAVTLPITWTPEYDKSSGSQILHTGFINPGVEDDPATDGIQVIVDGGSGKFFETPAPGSLPPSNLDPLYIRNLTVDQENLTLTINDLREANRLQQWLEKSARGGSRYIETILSHFGVQSSDARLQRPEYLGGMKQPIMMSEVLNTASDQSGSGVAPLGEYAGHGISVGGDMGFSRTFEEHGYVMGIMSILPRTAYFEGVHPHWERKDRFDYYWPEFANLGEQEIKKRELYLDPTDDTYNNQTFGYQQRYAEYKYAQSSFHGEFRTNGYLQWHLGRNFDPPNALDRPELNDKFVKCIPSNEDLNRIFAVPNNDVDHFIIQMYHDVRANRPMPYFAIPQL